MLAHISSRGAEIFFLVEIDQRKIKERVSTYQAARGLIEEIWFKRLTQVYILYNLYEHKIS